ncbi:hypothetical protein RD792_003061 [Penstemon davidsonii]|uniref:Fatty acyl-CoA reductase n=1 Tax=Penstemon davidsonii TaxID=160366 RepID=A0ABR0DSQ7_9LAMI|nr:hypothetical protein RD792_003061 [Penstemon davidsonii]
MYTVLLEKILRVQPNVNKFFLLIRPSSNKSVQQRLQEEVVNSSLFGVVREKYGEEALSSHIQAKVIPVLGDVSHANLGVVDSNLINEMWNEIDIIVNSAATTKFDERYDVALAINSLGSLHLKSFAGKCAKLKMFLHVSTAFVSGTKTGLITEKPFRMGETLIGAKISYLDINKENELVRERLRELQIQNANQEKITSAMKDLGMERALLHGWPNTYVFTKAMGEMLLENFMENVKVIIARPTIVTSTYKEPFPGWIEGARTLDGLFVAYGKGNVKVFIGDPQTTLDVIPGDMVVNSMLAAMATHSTHEPACSNSEFIIYHIGSSLRNPIKYKDIQCLILQFLEKNPLFDNSGKPIKLSKPVILNTMTEFRGYIATHYLPFLNILKLVNKMSCNYYKSSYANARRKINRAMRIAELYKPFTFFYGIFDDFNTETMRRTLRRSNVDASMFEFDPICIQWEQYFMNTHFPGLVKYALK